MQIGYARAGTAEQEEQLNAQVCELKEHGCDLVFSERVLSAAPRDRLEAALDYLREGDALVVTRLDRLARSMANLMELIGKLDARRASLKVLAIGMDTGTTTGQLMVNVLESVLRFEREVMLERQREGIARAKAEGRYRGREPTARRKAPEVLRLRAAGTTPIDIARRLDISRSSVFRILRDQRAA